MSLHHLLQNMHEQIFIQAIDQHFETDEIKEELKAFSHKEYINDFNNFDECQNIDVKFYFSFDEEEDSNDVSTVDDSEEYETLRDSLTSVNKKTSLANFLNLNDDAVKVEISKIRNETVKDCKMFQLRMQNKIKIMNQYYEMQMKNYINLVNSTNANNLNKSNVANVSSLNMK